MTETRLPGPVVSVDWVHAHLAAPDVVVLDGRYYLPPEGVDAHAAYLEAHLPGASWFDIDAMSDPDASCPHTLPSAALFGDAVGRLGIGNDSLVVVYDDRPLFSAARVWWMFRVFGHERVAVMDGGLPVWQARGYPVERGGVASTSRSFVAAEPLSSMVCARDAVQAQLARSPSQVVDARSAARFAGSAPEPRPGLRGGHMPGSTNLPFSLLTGDDGLLRDPAAIATLLRERGVDLDRPMITSCGSGLTAAVVYLAAHLAGAANIRLYDGSWSEWGDPALDLPVAQSRAD